VAGEDEYSHVFSPSDTLIHTSKGIFEIRNILQELSEYGSLQLSRYDLKM
jgi:hypothetical protein